MTIPENYFDRSKIFYPYILNYIANLHGLISLLSRGVQIEVNEELKPYKHIDIENFIDEKVPNKINEKLKQFIKNKAQSPSLGNLAPKSLFLDKSINISLDEIAIDFVNNFKYLLPFQVKAAGILLIAAYENTKMEYDNKDAIWNFLYHCRNASAHGGIFNITNKKRFPAKWGHMEITVSLNKTNLFFMPENGGLLGLGDPIRLLWEIETNYIS